MRPETIRVMSPMMMGVRSCGPVWQVERYYGLVFDTAHDDPDVVGEHNEDVADDIEECSIYP